MSRATTITDLKDKVKWLEKKKQEVDKQLEAVYTTLRLFEERAQDGLPTAIAKSDYAAQLTDAMHGILIDERPLHRTVILERLSSRGIRVGGRTPVNTVGSYLSTDKRFKNVGRGTWDLAEEPVDDVENDDSEDNSDNGWQLPDRSVRNGPYILTPVSQRNYGQPIVRAES